MERQPCAKRIWRNCATDQATVEFSDGSIYTYSFTGAANEAGNMVNAGSHGNWFNFNLRVDGSGSYVKVGGPPSGSKLIYTYPPYPGQHVCDCDGTAEPAYALADVTWDTSGLPSYATFTGSAGNVTLAITGTGALNNDARVDASALCIQVPSHVHVDLTMSSGDSFAEGIFELLGTSFACTANGTSGTGSIDADYHFPDTVFFSIAANIHLLLSGSLHAVITITPL